jgi:hypothetical protein
MTFDEIKALNREISEGAEPFESLPEEGLSIQSPLQAWDLFPAGQGVLAWIPRDWTGDETASAWLLDWMIEEHDLQFHFDSEGMTVYYPPFTFPVKAVVLAVNYCDYSDIAMIGRGRKLAVALAAREWIRRKSG